MKKLNPFFLIVVKPLIPHIRAVVNVLKSKFITQGPMINEFESNFSKYVGAKYAVACSNGTAALYLALKV